MAKLRTREIQARAIELLETQAGGIRFKALVYAIAAESPETPFNTINTQVGDLPRKYPDLVTRPERGLLQLIPGGDPTYSPGNSTAGAARIASVRTMPNEVTSLIDLGFLKVGSWVPKGDGIEHAITIHGEQERILYAFVISGEVMYIGKSRRTLRRRMYTYQNFGSTQSTNIKNNGNIRAALELGKAVEIWALVDVDPTYHRGIPVNIAAGLEDELVERMRPPWNGWQPEAEKSGIGSSIDRRLKGERM